MTHFYVKVSNEFYELNKEFSKDNIRIGFVFDDDGECYVSANTLNEFPELFDASDVVIVQKTREDFSENLAPIGQGLESNE